MCLIYDFITNFAIRKIEEKWVQPGLELEQRNKLDEAVIYYEVARDLYKEKNYENYVECY
jgi:hypothetical protein